MAHSPDSTHTLDDLVDDAPGEVPKYNMHKVVQYALQGSPSGRLTLPEIIDAINAKFPQWYENRGDTLNRTVRHVLTGYPKFVMVGRPPNGKGKAQCWQIDPDHLNDPPLPSNSSMRRTRAHSSAGHETYHPPVPGSSGGGGRSPRKERSKASSPTTTRPRRSSRATHSTAGFVPNSIPPSSFLVPSTDMQFSSPEESNYSSHSPSQTFYHSGTPSTQHSASPLASQPSYSPLMTPAVPSEPPMYGEHHYHQYSPSTTFGQHMPPMRPPHDMSLFPNGSGPGFVQPVNFPYFPNQPSIQYTHIPTSSSFPPSINIYQPPPPHLSSSSTHSPAPFFPMAGPSTASDSSEVRSYNYHPAQAGRYREEYPAIDPDLDSLPYFGAQYYGKRS